MDYLVINQLKVKTRIGVHAWEQAIKQTLLIDLRIESDFKDCRDELLDTLDYDLLCKEITEWFESRAFQLIETVANELASFIQTKFNVQHLNVAISKPHAVKNAQSIQVIVNRP